MKDEFLKTVKNKSGKDGWMIFETILSSKKEG
jgi:hypothetical protein